MRKIFLLTFIIVALASSCFTAKAQYATAIGARYGIDAGIGANILQFLGDRNQMAGRLIVSVPYGGFRVNADYELHIRNHSENIEITGVGFFLGAGGHLGRYKTLQYRKDDMVAIKKENTFAAGIDGFVGIEWKLPFMPLLLSADFHPFLDLNYDNQPNKWEIGLTLCYLFEH
jgi:hypothetical protein